MATLGKSLGTAGAFVAGSQDAIETLVQHARTYIYTTAMPPAIAVAALASLGIAREESWRRAHLERLVQRFRAGASTLGLALSASQTRSPAHRTGRRQPPPTARAAARAWCWSPGSIAHGAAWHLRLRVAECGAQRGGRRLLDALTAVRGTGHG
jgi:8-amino-7-oxononanoate synthase